MVDPGAASLPPIAPILLLATQLHNEVRRWEEKCEVVIGRGRSKVEELERRRGEVAAVIAARSSEAMEVDAAIRAKRGEVARIRRELKIRRVGGGQWRREEQGGTFGGTMEKVERVEKEEEEEEEEEVEAPTSPVADITFHPLPSMCSSPLPATGLSHSQKAMEVAGGGWGGQGTGGMEMVGDMNNGREEDSIVKLVVVQVKEGGEDWLEDQLAAMAELVRRERRRYREEIGGRLATVHEEAMGEVIRMAFHPITLPGTPRWLVCGFETLN